MKMGQPPPEYTKGPALFRVSPARLGSHPVLALAVWLGSVVIERRLLRGNSLVGDGFSVWPGMTFYGLLAVFFIGQSLRLRGAIAGPRYWVWLLLTFASVLLFLSGATGQVQRALIERGDLEMAQFQAITFVVFLAGQIGTLALAWLIGRKSRHRAGRQGAWLALFLLAMLFLARRIREEIGAFLRLLDSTALFGFNPVPLSFALTAIVGLAGAALLFFCLVRLSAFESEGWLRPARWLLYTSVGLFAVGHVAWATRMIPAVTSGDWTLSQLFVIGPALVLISGLVTALPFVVAWRAARPPRERPVTDSLYDVERASR